MTGSGRSGRRHTRQHGAVALIVALSMTFLVVAVAMLLDFGIVRLDRQVNKSATDAAAISGIRSMEATLGKPMPWAGACAALAYLKVNKPELASGLANEAWRTGGSPGTPVIDPCNDPNRLDDLCLPGTESTWARYVGYVPSAANPRITVEIKAGYRVTEDGFPEESMPSLLTDQGDVLQAGCDQLAVIITEKRDPGLGSLATSSDLSSRIRSVARVVTDGNNKAPVALLILEQHDCSAISTDGAGTKLWVLGNDKIPGLIHSDSLGDTPGNTGKCQDSQIVGGSGQIKAFKAPMGSAPGVIGIHALDPSSGGLSENAYDPDPKVVAEGAPGNAPEGRRLVTRSEVDARYLGPVTTVVQAAWPKFSWTQSVAEDVLNGYTWITPADCGGSGINRTFTEAKVYLNCPSGAVFDDTTFEGTHVIVNGSVSVKSNAVLALPNAQEFLIKGPGAGANVDGLNNGGTLRVHDKTDASCVTNDSPASGRAVVVVGSGRFSSTSGDLLRLCQTTLITMGNTVGMPTYTDPGAAPADNTRNGNLNVTGGDADWSAPNAKPTTPSVAADWAQLEDLAFWTETSAESRIVGNGDFTLEGIFILPNANPFKIGGTGVQKVEDSQYLTRKLVAAGGGELKMKPDPNNSFLIDYEGDFALVR